MREISGLAVAHRAVLLSRDRTVLTLTRALRTRGVRVQAEWPGLLPAPPQRATAG